MTGSCTSPKGKLTCTKSTGNILTSARDPIIRSIERTETFQEEDTVELTAEELKEAQAIHEEARLRRRDPAAYQAKLAARQRRQMLEYQQKYPQFYQASPQAQHQAYPLGQAPTPPQGSRYYIHPNAHGAPSGVDPHGHVVHGYSNINQAQTGVHSTQGPNTPHDAARVKTPKNPVQPFRRPNNVPPILGANTIRDNVLASPERRSAGIPLAHQAETEPCADGVKTVADGRASTAAATQPEPSTASTSEHNGPTSPDQTVKTAEPNPPKIPHTTGIQSSEQKPLQDKDPYTPTPAPTLKRKLSQSSAQTVQEPPEQRASSTTPSAGRTNSPYPPLSKAHSREAVDRGTTPRSSFGFNSLNKLFRRESTRNAKPDA